MNPSHQTPEQMLRALHVELAAEGVREQARYHALSAFRETLMERQGGINLMAQDEHLRCEEKTSLIEKI